MAMKGSVIFWEAKRFANLKVLAVLLLIVVLGAYFVLNSGFEYKRILENVKEFQENEDFVQKNYRHYEQYQENGFHILAIPNPASVVFSSPSDFSELTAHVNSVASLDIYDNRKPDRNKKCSFPIQINYVLFIIIVVLIIGILIGFNAPRDTAYLSMISSVTNRPPGKLIIPILMVRFVFLTMCFIMITGMMLGLTMLIGIDISWRDVAGFWPFITVACLAILVNVFAGALVGKIKQKRKAYPVLLLVWLGILVGLPFLINSVYELLAVDVTSTYKVNKNVLKNINNFELRIVKKHGKFDRKRIDVFRNEVNGYVKNEYKENEGMETGIREQKAKNADTYNTLSMFSPVSFYFQTASAAGSCSDHNLIAFYKYAQDTKLNFLLFIIQRTYYNDPKVMMSFVKGDENLFYAQSHLPPNFWTGVFLNLFIVLVLGVVTFFVYRRDDTNAKFVIVPRVPPGEMNSNISYNRYSALYVKNDRLRDFLFKLFSGVIPGSLKAADWSLKIDDVDVFSEEFQGDFFYICRPGDIPGDIKVKNFLSFFASLGGLPSEQKESILAATELQKLMNKRFHQLEDAESFEVMFSLTRLVKRKVYLVDDILGDLGHTYALRMLKRMMEIGKKGDIILYLTHRLRAPEKMEEFNGDVDFCRGDTWLYDLKSRGLVLED